MNTIPVLKKPPEVEGDAFKSAKWDELTAGRRFPPSAAPVLAILCQWYKILHQAVAEMDEFGGQTVYENSMHDIKALPQIATIKTASAEIRQLNKQLGIEDGGTATETEAGGDAEILKLVTGGRKDRRARAAV